MSDPSWIPRSRRNQGPRGNTNTINFPDFEEFLRIICNQDWENNPLKNREIQDPPQQKTSGKESLNHTSSFVPTNSRWQKERLLERPTFSQQQVFYTVFLYTVLPSACQNHCCHEEPELSPPRFSHPCAWGYFSSTTGSLALSYCWPSQSWGRSGNCQNSHGTLAETSPSTSSGGWVCTSVFHYNIPCQQNFKIATNYFPHSVEEGRVLQKANSIWRRMWELQNRLNGLPGKLACTQKMLKGLSKQTK